MRLDPQWMERLWTIHNIDDADLPSLEEAIQINDQHLILRTCRDAMRNSPDQAVRVEAADLLARIKGFYK